VERESRQIVVLFFSFWGKWRKVETAGRANGAISQAQTRTELSFSISWDVDDDDDDGDGEMVMMVRRSRLVTQFVMQTGRVNRQRWPYSPPTHVRLKQRETDGVPLPNAK